MNDTVRLQRINSIFLFVHPVVNHLRHAAKDEFGDAAEPKLVEASVAARPIKGAVAVGLGVEVVQNLPLGFVLGKQGDVQGDAASAAAEVLQQGVCAAHHGQGTLGARPRREINVPAGGVAVERMRLNRLLPTELAQQARNKDFGRGGRTEEGDCFHAAKIRQQTPLSPVFASLLRSECDFN